MPTQNNEQIILSHILVSVFSQDTERPKILHRMVAKFPNFNLFLNSHIQFSFVSKGKATHYRPAGPIPAGVSGFFIDIKSFWSHYGPGVDSASNWNE